MIVNPLSGLADYLDTLRTQLHPIARHSTMAALAAARDALRAHRCTPAVDQEDVTARLAAVLERYQSMPVEPGGFVRYPREYTTHAPAWTLAAELAAALRDEP